MSVEVNMPRLGIMMDEGTITQWHVKVGDTVNQGDPVVDFETSKLVNTIEAPASGVIEKIFFEEGAEVECGGVLALIGDGSAAPAEEPAPAVEAAPVVEEAPAAAPAAEEVAAAEGDVEVNMPRLGIMMDEGTITQWHVKEGDTVNQGDPVVDFETSKLVNTIEAPASGVIKKIFFEEGAEVECGGVLALIATKSEAAAPAAPIEEAKPAEEEKPADGKRVSKVVPLIGPRKVISKRMHQSLSYSPQGTTTCKLDVTNLLAFKKAKTEEGTKYTVTDLFVKAVSLALVQHPILNSAQIDDKIYTYESVNIGVAVAVGDNLLVPVVKESQDKSLAEISAELKDMVNAARDGSIDMTCLKDSTFTITSLGMYNVDYCTPLLNVPEAAILCIGKFRKEPIWNDEKGEFEPRDMVPLSLTSDHTVLDGAPAAKFLGTLGEILAKPEEFLL